MFVGPFGVRPDRAKANWTQGAQAPLGSHVRTVRDSGAGSVPKPALDNLKTGISDASFDDPAINR